MELIESKYAKAYKQEIENMFSKSEVDVLWKNAETIFHKLTEENPEQSEAGFSHEFISDSNKCLAFNVTRCPYRDYCEKYGCGEIVHVFCKNDEYAYGNLPGIRFIRTQTLGTGGNCCDFKLER